MTTAYYQQLALSWKPESRSDRQFKLITLIVVIIMLAVGIVLSSINLPEKKRETRLEIPERIANFILEKDKPKPKIEKPKPKPKPIKKPLVKKTTVKKAIQKPLTKVQKKAREKAADSGLLALSNELSDLMDTSSVSAMVGGKVKSSSAASTAASYDKGLLTANVTQGSAGVDANQYATNVGTTRLSEREITQVRQALLSPEAQSKGGDNKGKSRSGTVRAEEDITIIFDQNKSKLYSIYNRARRSNPGLKGKIVLEITIAPSGKVTAIRIVSSELNDPKLEKRLLSRIKLFNFGSKKVQPVTVTYPIEFLPS